MNIIGKLKDFGSSWFTIGIAIAVFIYSAYYVVVKLGGDWFSYPLSLGLAIYIFFAAKGKING